MKKTLIYALLAAAVAAPASAFAGNTDMFYDYGRVVAVGPNTITMSSGSTYFDPDRSELHHFHKGEMVRVTYDDNNYVISVDRS
jgi:hypothetical protein